MELTRTQIIDGVFAEYEEFSGLIAGLTPEQWATPTRCKDWEVRDIAGHVVALADDVAAGVAGQRNPDEQARALRGETAADLAARLQDSAKQLRPLMDFLDDNAWGGPSPLPSLTIGEAVHRIWFDTYVHGDDIRTALGMPADRGPGLAGSVASVVGNLRGKGWGPASFALDGIPPFELGDGGGPRVDGDPRRFLLAATGRIDAADVGLDASVNIFR